MLLLDRPELSVRRIAPEHGARLGERFAKCFVPQSHCDLVGVVQLGTVAAVVDGVVVGQRVAEYRLAVRGILEGMHLRGVGRFIKIRFISKGVLNYLMGVPHEVNVIAGHQKGGLVEFLETEVPFVTDQSLLKKLVIHEVW